MYQNKHIIEYYFKFYFRNTGKHRYSASKITVLFVFPYNFRNTKNQNANFKFVSVNFKIILPAK